MNRLVLASLLAILALASSPLCGEAQNRIGIHGFFGYQTHSMDDINNQLIDPINDELLGVGALDDITGGLSFGGGLVYDIGPTFRVALDYERLNASSEFSADGGSLEIRVPADVLLLTGTYFFPSQGKVRLGLGGGLASYNSAAALEVSVPGESQTLDFDGSTIGWHLQGQADFALSNMVHAEAGIGYRGASVEAEFATEIPRLFDDLDWGGFMSRVGLLVFFQ